MNNLKLIVLDNIKEVGNNVNLKLKKLRDENKGFFRMFAD